MTGVDATTVVEVDAALQRLTTPVAQCGPRAMRHLLGRTIAETLNMPLDRALDAAEAILDLTALVQWRAATRQMGIRHAHHLNALPDRTHLPLEVTLRSQGLHDDVALAYICTPRTAS